jgi:hypothetical protein
MTKFEEGMTQVEFTEQQWRDGELDDFELLECLEAEGIWPHEALVILDELGGDFKPAALATAERLREWVAKLIKEKYALKKDLMDAKEEIASLREWTI